jgi:spermidine/putrescine transport system permease protein
VSAVAVEERVRREAPAPVRRRRPRPGRFVLPAFTALVIGYLIFPLTVMIIFSFNDTEPADRIVLRWRGFTTAFYRRIFEIGDLTEALRNSIVIAVSSTVVATTFGTLIALALVRHRFRGRGVLETVQFLNIASPEIVLGASLLSLFVSLGVPRGMLTIFIAHVMFSVPFVAVTVRARLAGFDRAVEEAAQDLYADPWNTFFRVTLPLIWPGIVAGALLAFALSIDDFVITQFNAGQTLTFPLWVFGAVKTGIPPQVFAMGTLIFSVGAFAAAYNLFGGRRR